MAQNRAQEIIGGIKNALERGETLIQTQQSFLNSGYTQQEITQATALFRQQHPGGVQVYKKEETTQNNTQTPQQVQTPQALTPGLIQAGIKEKKPRTKKWLYITIIICTLIILAGAAFLGLFWEQFTDMMNTIW